MSYILFDDKRRINLQPLCFYRPVAEIRVGILTIREKWEKFLLTKTSTLTEEYLADKYPIRIGNINIFINGGVFPDKKLVSQIRTLEPNQALCKDDVVLAVSVSKEDIHAFLTQRLSIDQIEYAYEIKSITNTWDIFTENAQQIILDFELVTAGRRSATLSKSNVQVGEEIFIEAGVRSECVSINAQNGPVYIGKDVELMDGSSLRGPVAICEHSTLKMGARIYEGTTIGPWCKIGGEVNNAVFFGYSNKAHDGFVGTSVIAEWCNFGAGTITSNLRNDYEKIKCWSYAEEKFVPTGLQFCGLIMGDYSVSGINCMFNSGSVVGTNCNIYGSGYQRNFIPNFTKGNTFEKEEIEVADAVSAAKRMMGRRNIEFSSMHQKLFEAVKKIT